VSWRTPSLRKRLAAGFTLSFVLLTVGTMALVGSITDRRHMASDFAVILVEGDILRGADGALRLRKGGRTEALAARSPGLWVLASDGRRDLVHGSPPPDARQVFPVLVRTARWQDPAVNLRVAADPAIGHATVERADTPAGRVTVMVGGVDPSAVGAGILGFYLFASGVTVLVPILVVLALVVLLIVRPIVLKGLRPLAAAASRLDGADPAMRLPEQGVMSELLPLVRALNSALERLEQAFEGRRRFMADVAHEFRTPLAVLTMHADELPEGRTRADLQRGLFRMSQMVAQMLDSERLGRPGRREPVDLAGVAREATADIAPLALEAGYQLEFAADAERVLVEGDAHAIKRAVTNLLGNAVAHAGGSGAIRVRVGADAVVEVSDEGAGVSEEARERVFEPFHRERWDRDGCGLGLHLVREIMRAHGGSAELADYGSGAIFRLVFPRPAAVREAHR
jgi:signal transduction histidine kinase